MKDTIQAEFQSSVVARLSPEDIRPKDMVTVLNEVVELPSFLWCCSSSLAPAEEPVRYKIMPKDPGKPYKVNAVCLPFIYATDIHDKLIVFDLRLHQLVRLDRKTARKIWKRMRRR